MKKNKNNIVSLNDYLKNNYTEHKQNPTSITNSILEYCNALSNTTPDYEQLLKELEKIDNDVLNLIFNAGLQIGYDSF